MPRRAWRGPTVEHREIFTPLCENLYGESIWKAMGTHMCITDLLCRSPENTTFKSTVFWSFFFFFKSEGRTWKSVFRHPCPAEGSLSSATLWRFSVEQVPWWIPEEPHGCWCGQASVSVYLSWEAPFSLISEHLRVFCYLVSIAVIYSPGGFRFWEHCFMPFKFT